MISTFVTILHILLLAAGLIFARPHQTKLAERNVAELAKEYARLHPNTGGHVGECQILFPDGSPHDDDIDNPLNAVTDPSLLWDNNTLYYTIAPTGYTADQISLIEAAIADLQQLTAVGGVPCIFIKPRTTQRDYVYVENYSGCSSYVGCQHLVDGQRISLVDSCVASQGSIMHEFLHAFGFYHEHQRTDRDTYVTVMWDNIDPSYYDNFVMLDETQIDMLGTSYDYGSLMHYGAYYFAMDPSMPTIVPTDSNAVIGQRVTLSAIDIERVQILYQCISPADSVYFKHLEPTAKDGNVER